MRGSHLSRAVVATGIAFLIAALPIDPAAAASAISASRVAIDEGAADSGVEISLTDELSPEKIDALTLPQEPAPEPTSQMPEGDFSSIIEQYEAEVDAEVGPAPTAAPPPAMTPQRQKQLAREVLNLPIKERDEYWLFADEGVVGVGAAVPG